MPNSAPSSSNSHRSLDEVVRVLDGASIIAHDFTACEQLYGWTRGEVVGHVVHDLLATVCPQSVESIRDQIRTSGLWTGELAHPPVSRRLPPVG